MARYAPNHPTNPPPKSKHRPHIEEQNELAQELCKLDAQQLWQRFSQERTFAQYFSERYLAVREKATVYPGEELDDDDPMLSQVVLENEIQLEINDAITHLESLLAIMSHTQKTLPATMLDIHGQDDNIELFWAHWRPSWNDAVNLWTLSCLLSSILLYTEKLSFLYIILLILCLISLIPITVFTAPYLWRWYRAYRIETLQTDILKLWYAFRTDPSSIDENSTFVLQEWRFWVLDWYLNGREEFSITKLITARGQVPDIRKQNKEWAWAWGVITNKRLNWGFRVPVLGADISVRITRSACTSSQMKENGNEKEKGGISSTEPYGGLDLGYYFTDD
ncbi:hypothetical protein QBC37DRAFT_377666 [Rhypophila decipiens]|uniref:Uncharacterized protein n=1 Tax=Rhypophila decipiens TaxID=261697 RepID=A0AAN6Y5K3_9PEZI|nr:hypothetical protein QBC37DRAFT_377666 [Rhypophila decipiens]